MADVESQTPTGTADVRHAFAVAQLPVPACVRHRDGWLIEVNEALADLFGVDGERLVGRDPDYRLRWADDRRDAEHRGRSTDGVGPGRAIDGHDGEPVVVVNGPSVTRLIRHVLPGDHLEHRLEVLMPRMAGVEAALRAEHEHLRRLADYDDLTQILNRRAFIEQCDTLLADGGALAVFDLDHFKQFNDRYGHDAGDATLVHVVEVVKTCLRDDDLVGRMGGEEFCIALSGASLEEAKTVAEQVRATIADTPVEVDGAVLPCTVSIGVHLVSGADGDDVSNWLRAADRLLYAAKRQGRNMVVSTGEAGDLEVKGSEASTFEAIVSDDGPFRVAELQAAARLLGSVMDHIPLAVFWKDRQSVYLGCNAFFAERAGLDAPADIVGLTDFDLPWAETDAAGFVEWDAHVMSTGEPEIDILERQLTSSGDTWLNTNKVPLVADSGEIVGILGTFQDITELKDQLAGAEIRSPDGQGPGSARR